jgi:hypothetical protein
MGEMDSAPSASTPKNAVADLLDLDFGSSEPAPYTSPPASTNQPSGAPNYSADLFDMSSDMSGSGVFGGMGGMSGMSGMGGLQQQQRVSSPPTSSSNTGDLFGDLGGFGQPPQQQQQQAKPAGQSSTVNDLLDLF